MEAGAAKEKHWEDWHSSRIYRADARYVRASANCHWRDGAPWCAVILGEGSDEWPEEDWNSIPLWRLRGRGDNYPLSGMEGLAEILSQMSSDLVKHAGDFLCGDTDRFARARLNRIGIASRT